jgi:hypothetical protein
MKSPPKGIGHHETETEMFASSRKAIVAIIGAVLYLAQSYFGISLGFLTPELIEQIIVVFMPAAVYATPNAAPST